MINVKEIKDPENIGSSFTNDGVILNASEEQLKDGKEAFEKGDQIEIILVENSIMTMSIPPQIPGNSIVEIARIEE